MSSPSNYPRPPLDPNVIPCPQCGQPTAKKVKYTWWGGAVGPALMNLAKCQSCKYEFNTKTGQSAQRGIILYNVISWSVALVLLAIWYLASRK